MDDLQTQQHVVFLKQLWKLDELRSFLVDLPIMVVGLPFFHELLAEFADEIKALADESKLEFSEIV